MAYRFRNLVFKEFVKKHAQPIVIKRADSVHINHIESDLFFTKAEIIGTDNYWVEVFFDVNSILNYSCSCPYTGKGICKHLVAVIQKTDELQHPLIIQSQLKMEKIKPEYKSDYQWVDIDFSLLNYKNILERATTMNSGYYDYFIVHSLEFNNAKIEFHNMQNQVVSVNYSPENKVLTLDCKCKTTKEKMCLHQAKVLARIIESESLLIYFDAQLRRKKYQEIAKIYGLEDEPDLENYFQLSTTRDGNSSLKIRNNGILAINQAKNEKLKTELIELPSFEKLIGSKNSHSELIQRIVVIGFDNYSDTLKVALYDARLKKDGFNLKNPLTSVDVQTEILRHTKMEELHFFAAIMKLENEYRENDFETDVVALEYVIKNHMNLPMYFHNTKISSKITSTSIEPVTMVLPTIDFSIKVDVKDKFYQITPQLIVDGKPFVPSQIALKFIYFLKEKNTYYLITNLQLVKLFHFFYVNGGKVLVHEKGFQDFKTNVLSQLENNISIDYTYLKKAPVKQADYSSINEIKKEKIIYISESEDFILITPVVKYQDVELPILTKKNLELSNAAGESYLMNRDSVYEDRFISILLRQHPNFSEQFGQSFYYLSKREFLEQGWFLDAFEVWKDTEVTVLGFNKIKNNLYNHNKAKINVNVTSGIDWFETTVGVEFGEQRVSLSQLQKAVKNQTNYVKLADGTHGLLPDEWIAKFAHYFRSGEVVKDKIRTSKLNFSLINEIYEDALLSNEISDEIQFYKDKLAAFKSIEKIKIPAGLKAKLRPYQMEGLNWLNFLDDYNFGGCLADDMGLGKTLQMIAFFMLQKKKHKGATNLVVLPTSLIFNWQNEIIKFAPSLTVRTIYGSDRVTDLTSLDSFDVVLTSYGTLMSDIELLKAYQFNYVVLDESQAIKNPDSQRYKAVRLLQARNRIVMTGTPIENNTFDLYAQLSFACPGLLGSQQQFREVYSIPIDKFKDDQRAKELQKRINPFLLRRTKDQVAKELPDKTEIVLYCEMELDQRKVYNAYKEQMKEYLNASKSQKKQLDSMFVLSALTKLRQICNSPALLSEEEFYGDSSAKINVLMEELLEKHGNHKVLVFSQFVGMLDLIKAELDKHGLKYAYLTGQSTKREKIVSEFQEDDEIRIFLISLKAGGTGLNLTQADYVYLVDPWWNPAVENQAIDRCYRIGQEKHVMAVRLITPNTIEEKIMELQQHKKTLASDIIQTDTSILKSLKSEDLLSLID
jgi:SNF2 family DNA or RNA helicase